MIAVKTDPFELKVGLTEDEYLTFINTYYGNNPEIRTKLSDFYRSLNDKEKELVRFISPQSLLDTIRGDANGVDINLFIRFQPINDDFKGLINKFNSFKK